MSFTVNGALRERSRVSLGRRMARCWQLYLLLIPSVVYIFIFNYDQFMAQ